MRSKQVELVGIQRFSNRHPLPLTLSRYLVLDPQLVRHHRDKFTIGRLRFRYINRIAKNKADAVDVAARPGDFNRVADSAFDAARGCFVFFGDGGVERLRNGY